MEERYCSRVIIDSSRMVFVAIVLKQPRLQESGQLIKSLISLGIRITCFEDVWVREGVERGWKLVVGGT